MGMLIWFLPTFLWRGEPLDETDRPFAKFPFVVGAGEVEKDFRRREEEDEIINAKDRVSNIYTTTTVASPFVKVYNRLFCPQCFARLVVIQGMWVR